MVVRRTSYPQVDPRAAGLMDRGVVVVPAPSRVTVGDAAGRAAGARGSSPPASAGPGPAPPGRRWRALALGLGEAPLLTVLWDTVLVAPNTPEVVVRRRLGPDRPFVLVGGARGPAGVMFRDAASPAGLPLSVAPRLERLAVRARAPPDRGDARGCPRPPRRRRRRAGPGSPPGSSGGADRSRPRRRGPRPDAGASARRRSVGAGRGAPGLPHGDRDPPGRPPNRPDDRAPRVLPGAGALPSVEPATLAERSRAAGLLA